MRTTTFVLVGALLVGCGKGTDYIDLYEKVGSGLMDAVDDLPTALDNWVLGLVNTVVVSKAAPTGNLLTTACRTPCGSSPIPPVPSGPSGLHAQGGAAAQEYVLGDPDQNLQKPEQQLPGESQLAENP